MTRDLLRYYKLIPEILDKNGPREVVLELSPGACAAHEILSPLGHKVILADYEVGEGSMYFHIHNEIGANPIHFDGRKLPLPFEDKSVDTAFCFQALDFYTSDANDYPTIFEDITRIARKRCVIIFNSYRPLSDHPARIQIIKNLFKKWDGIHWTICPDTKLLAMIYNIDTQISEA